MRVSTMPEPLVNEGFVSSVFLCPFLVMRGGGET